MSKTKLPNYHPIEMLPTITHIINESLDNVVELTISLKIGIEKPGALTDDIVNRAVKIFKDGQELAPVHSEQLKRWRQTDLSLMELEEVDILQEIVDKLPDLYTEGLDIANEVSKFTIDKIMAMDSTELAIKYLTGEMKLN